MLLQPGNTVPTHRMAAFLIFCRTSEISPHHFEVRVSVMPVGERDSGIVTRSECRIFESSALAASECARMTEAMKGRLSRSGHEVVGIEQAMPNPAAITLPAEPAARGSG